MIMHKLLSRRSSRLAFFLCLAVGGVDDALPGQTAVRRLDAAHFHPGPGGGIGVRAQGVPRPKLRVPEDGSPGKSTRVRDWHLVSDVGLYYGEDGLGPALACTFDGHLGITIRNRRRLRGPAQEQADGLPFWPGELTLISGPVSLSAPAKMYRNPDDGMVTVRASVAVDEPVLAEFGRTGRIVVAALGDTRRPGPAPLDAVNLVLDACRE